MERYTNVRSNMQKLTYSDEISFSREHKAAQLELLAREPRHEVIEALLSRIDMLEHQILVLKSGVIVQPSQPSPVLSADEIGMLKQVF